jgi:HAMP domain-containing protein
MKQQLKQSISNGDLRTELLALLENFNRNLWFYYDKILDSIGELADAKEVDDIAAEVNAYTLSVSEVAGAFHRKAQKISSRLGAE